MKVFYSRISTNDGSQNDERQLQNLNGFDYVLSDKCSGTIPLWERPKGGQIKKLIDNKQLKLFVNISDIKDANGPFCFFPDSATGSIKSVASTPLGRISDEEIKVAGVSQRMKRASGGKGQCLFVDSSRCFHAGSRVSEGHRLMIMVQFVKPNCVYEPKKSAWSHFIDKNPAVLSKIDKKKRPLFERPIWG